MFIPVIGNSAARDGRKEPRSHTKRHEFEKPQTNAAEWESQIDADSWQETDRCANARESLFGGAFSFTKLLNFPN
jgi:hypothetical protein